MKNNQQKEQISGEQLLQDINSVPKEAPDNNGTESVDEPKRPAQGGRHGAGTVEDGGQDVGSGAGSH